MLAIAAGVVFFGLLAVFPAITALVSCYGLFADPSTISSNLQSLALMLPEGSFQIVQDQIGRVLGKGPTTPGATFLFGLALALWSANARVKAVVDALNVVHGEREKRGFIALHALFLTFTVRAIVTLLWLAGSAPLSWHLSNFGNHGAIYGSPGAAIGLMMWMSAIIVLCGAELNSAIEHQTAVDTTVGPGRPMDRRGAMMADTPGVASS